ncbi:CHAD domain-containing protein [Aquabacter sp. CN5-332]|uniref:CHAD domain-containing protein n=1 Tax=Aquabacter sp. CN5-332 TaxID=3156608 RepID=UPI0032B493AF
MTEGQARRATSADSSGTLWHSGTLATVSGNCAGAHFGSMPMTHADPTAPSRRPLRSGRPARRAVDGAALAAQFETALDKVEQALALPDATEMVHDARKAIKEYRALLRLMGSDEAKAARRLAADAARELSSSRDRQACRDALADMAKAERLGPEDADRAASLIGKDQDGADEAASHERTLRGWLTEAHARHAATLDAEACETDILDGVRKGYAKARAADDFSAPERMHDLRKRVVTHRYQMSFLADLPAGTGKRRARRTQKLRDVLGTYQDIETLRHHLDGAGARLPEELRARLAEAADARQHDLIRKARALHADLFDSKAKAFGQKLERKLARKAGKSAQADTGDHAPS